MDLVVRRVGSLQGQIRPPSDKSLTHRAYMLGAAAISPSTIESPLPSEDCQATLKCLVEMGLETERQSTNTVLLKPAAQWRHPDGDLCCGNSGTTIRLLSGMIACRPIKATLSGDASLSRRPMKRIAEPLRKMGAGIEGDTPPILVCGSSKLKGIDYRSPVASAQVKSCVLLAGLKASGATSVVEPALSRDHTERMLSALGVHIVSCQVEDGFRTVLEGNSDIDGFEFKVPSDISSAAFFMVASAVIPGGKVSILDVGINPTRTGILDVLEQVGVPWTIDSPRQELNEPIGDLEVGESNVLRSFEISGSLVPRLIDEIPVLAVLASQCDGVSSIRDAGELRVKESDRIELIAQNLKSMGGDVEVHEDGLKIGGPCKLKGGVVDCKGDHRIAMAFAVAGLIAEGDTVIRGAECIATSYPNFEEDLWRLCAV